MIPNTELRIGNNVLYADKIAVVKSIQAHKVCISVNNRHIKCSYEDIFPVVLTDEMLSDFGWEKRNPDKYPRLEGIYYNRFVIEKGISMIFDNSYSFRITTDAKNSTHARSISHVHELQNSLFILQGIEFKLKQENGSERTN